MNTHGEIKILYGAIFYFLNPNNDQFQIYSFLINRFNNANNGAVRGKMPREVGRFSTLSVSNKQMYREESQLQSRGDTYTVRVEACSTGETRTTAKAYLIK